VKSSFRFALVAAAALSIRAAAAAPWIETAQFSRSGGSANDMFSASLALDGDTAAVSNWPTTSSDPAVFVFTRSGNNWNEVATLIPADSSDNYFFGFTLGISGDVIAVAGATGTFVFVRPAGGWSGTLHESARLQAGISAVAFAGSSIVVGSEVFVEPVTGWSGTIPAAATLAGSDTPFLDGGVAASADTVVVANALAENGGHAQAGEAYVFVKPAGGWSGVVNESARLFPSDPEDDVFFGSAVAVDGSTVVVTRLTNINGGSTQGQLPGKGYVFEEPSGGWAGSLNEQAQLVGSDVSYPSLFGFSASMSKSTVVIGDYLRPLGAAYVFVRPAGGWTGTLQEDQELDGPESGDDFGYDLAISGTTIMVGAFHQTVDGNPQQGEAHVFDVARPSITQIRFLVRGPIRVGPGVPVEFPFQVDSLRDSRIAPTGEVVVSDGAGHSCRSDITASGEGSCTLTFGAPGTYRVRAQYLGNLAFASSMSPAEPVLVGSSGGAP
jgi:hypothetical protein